MRGGPSSSSPSSSPLLSSATVMSLAFTTNSLPLLRVLRPVSFNELMGLLEMETQETLHVEIKASAEKLEQEQGQEEETGSTEREEENMMVLGFIIEKRVGWVCEWNLHSFGMLSNSLNYEFFFSKRDLRGVDRDLKIGYSLSTWIERWVREVSNEKLCEHMLVIIVQMWGPLHPRIIRGAWTVNSVFMWNYTYSFLNYDNFFIKINLFCPNSWIFHKLLSNWINSWR